jgi:phosphoserine phosphatase
MEYATLAVIFDFDDTLVPDSTTQFLKAKGIDTDDFWRNQAASLIADGYDPALAFLKLFLDNVGYGKKLGPLRNAELRDFGKNLDSTFYSGLPGLFDDLRSIAEKETALDLEFFIISGGLREMVMGSAIVQKYFSAVYGCELAEGDDGYVRHIKRCVSFTEKTRYLFEINKGLDPRKTYSNPLLVNEHIAETARPTPVRNMIYVGDGFTDIPCFSVVQKGNGTAFGVFDPSQESSARKALIKFLKPNRVISVHSPRYGPSEDLGAMLRAAVAARCAQIRLERDQALPS